MPPKAQSTDLSSHSFASKAEFETFLEHNHATLPGLQLKLAKKASGIQSIPGAEAVEVALCYGWIDGQANGIDDKWWTVRFTPRRAKSIWSQKNVKTVGRLIEEGRMRPAGIAAVDAAKADGRWDRAYAGPATITVPNDLTAQLADEPSAAAFFASLNKSDRYSVLWRIETASAQSRQGRIAAIVQQLAAGTVPGGGKVKAGEKAEKPKTIKQATSTKVSKSLVNQKKPTVSQEVPQPPPGVPRRAGLRKRPG